MDGNEQKTGKNTQELLHKKYLCLVFLFAIVFVWSAIKPVSWIDWLWQAGSVIIGIFFLTYLYNREQFRFTSLVYTLIFIHAIILLVAAHYTYASVPLFDWIKDVLKLERNDYDRLAHFFQGFSPVFVMRELLYRKLNMRKYVAPMSIGLVMGLSALWELIEWIGTITTGHNLVFGQGDPYDTQHDMFMALVGSVMGLLVLSRLHMTLMQRIEKNRDS